MADGALFGILPSSGTFPEVSAERLEGRAWVFRLRDLLAVLCQSPRNQLRTSKAVNKYCKYWQRWFSWIYPRMEIPRVHMNESGIRKRKISEAMESSDVDAYSVGSHFLVAILAWAMCGGREEEARLSSALCFLGFINLLCDRIPPTTLTFALSEAGPFFHLPLLNKRYLDFRVVLHAMSRWPECHEFANRWQQARFDGNCLISSSLDYVHFGELLVGLHLFTDLQTLPLCLMSALALGQVGNLLYQYGDILITPGVATRRTYYFSKPQIGSILEKHVGVTGRINKLVEEFGWQVTMNNAFKDLVCVYAQLTSITVSHSRSLLLVLLLLLFLLLLLLLLLLPLLPLLLLLPPKY